VYGEEKNILYWADQSSQARIKVSCTGISVPDKNSCLVPSNFKKSVPTAITFCRWLAHPTQIPQQNSLRRPGALTAVKTLLKPDFQANKKPMSPQDTGRRL
jgi:hypothetical protein